MSTTSPVRLRSSRANGALSRGPKTAAGKLRSTGNRCTHGLYSKRLVLKTESQEEFDTLHQQFIADVNPRTSLESIAVRDWAIATPDRHVWEPGPGPLPADPG